MALYAFLAVPQDLYPGQLAFRVGTPAAAQRAAFQEYIGADAGTIVDAEFLDIEYQSHGGLLFLHDSFSLLSDVFSLIDSRKSNVAYLLLNLI